MKRTCVALILGAVVFAFSSPAAAAAPPFADLSDLPMSVRVFSGLSLAKFRYSEIDPGPQVVFSPRTGIIGGFGLEMGGLVSFEINIVYHQKGNRSDFDYYGGGRGNESILCHEMSVPLLVKLNIGRTIHPYLLAGGEAGYLLSAITSSESWNGNNHVSERIDSTEDFHRVHFGLIAGGGIKIPAGMFDVFLEARYHYGLSKRFKTVEGDPTQARADSLVVLIGISTEGVRL